MSNALKKKKKPKNTYSLKLGDYNSLRLRNTLENCSQKIFRSLQFCTLYVLYAPEYFDWDSEKIKEFTRRLEENDKKFGRNTKGYEEEAIVISEEMGIDLERESKIFPHRIKVKMGDFVPKKNEIPATVLYFAESVKESLFLFAYTLFHDFGMDAADIRERFLPWLKEIGANYANGMTDEHMLKYFEDVEGLEVLNWEETEDKDEI